jgi:exodeoxyribonuclease VIII
MNAITELTPGLYEDLSNQAYHAAPGVSKSGLDLIAHNPAAYIWNRSAPVDEEKTGALDMGTALHCLLLEPLEFDRRFIKAPEFNRRTKDGKAEEAAFLAECADTGKIVLSAEDWRKLDLMAQSVSAHPVASWLLSQPGKAEQSIFWTDEETGELCRIRPDWMLTEQPIIVDVKKVDGLDRFERHAEEFRYHVQDAMYSDGYYHHFGTWPRFLFLIVSSSISAGRYPVDVVELEPDWKQSGHELYRRDLNTYHQCRQNDDWLHTRTLKRPYWAGRD